MTIGGRGWTPWRPGWRIGAPSGRCGIVSCSALKRAYRDRLRRADPDLRFVLLHPDRDTLARRVASRPGHPFPHELLQSQLETLEPPDPDESIFQVDPQLPPDAAARPCASGWRARTAEAVQPPEREGAPSSRPARSTSATNSRRSGAPGVPASARTRLQSYAASSGSPRSFWP